ncbi:nucleotide-binding protein [Devosia neptuniae]|uniref:nucleotide-binding protein n=1 Tax=Devosia neptuniae TaxID=191302 RepID=UPI0022AF803A|nr:nucleotide-binding protein [Devosia neptuniae]MCZ4345497.1 nucleotide-binding protein [Devosia neptuniae]
MFSLLVAGHEDAWKGDEISFGIGRFLQQTQEPIQQKFEKSGRLQFARTLESLPALIGNEAALKVDFRLANIRNLRQDKSDLRFSIDWTDTVVPVDSIANDEEFFELAGWKLNTTHWAVKSGKLLHYLKKKGLYDGPTEELSSLVPRPILLDAGRMLATLSHSDLDSVLIEWDIPELEAPKTLGSRQDRANSITQFAAVHADVLVLDGNRLDEAIVERARQELRDHTIPDVPDAVRERFGRAVGAIKAPASRETNARSLFAKPQDLGGQASSQIFAVPSEPIQMTSPPEPPSAISTAALNAAANALPQKPRVFIVHGRDDPLKIEVENYLRKIGVEPVILHEQDNRGRHLLTKFMEVAASCSAAVVLVAAEDLGRHTSETDLQDRARQNVVLELGYFLGALGPKKTFMIVKGRPEMPSDMQGIVHIPHAGDWKKDLARELSGADIMIDAHAALRA